MPLEWEELVTQLDTHMPREAWAQTLVGIGVLILTALFVQWVVAGWCCCWRTACWC